VIPLEIIKSVLTAVGAGVIANFVYDFCKWLYSKTGKIKKK
jgi:hypothetical protein